MRKVMLLAAMMAMVLAAAAPALGQGSVNQSANQFGVVDDSVCSQVYNIAVQQYNAGDQTANADAFADADATAGAFGTAAAAAVAAANAANIANAAGINVDTVNVCLNNFTTVTPTAKTVTPTAKTVTPKATVHAKKTVTATATAKVAAQVQYGGGGGGAGGGGGGAMLPETGGASLLALGAGALLVGGGLVARRIAR